MSNLSNIPVAKTSEELLDIFDIFEVAIYDVVGAFNRKEVARAVMVDAYAMGDVFPEEASKKFDDAADILHRELSRLSAIAEANTEPSWRDSKSAKYDNNLKRA